MTNRFIFTLSLMLGSLVTFAAGGSLKFEKTTHNFGNIPEKGGNATYVFKFKNVGKGSIKIIQILSSCGCTTSDYTKGVINGGDSGYVKAIFDPQGRPGSFSRDLTVITNGVPDRYTLVVEGNVGSPDAAMLAAFPYQIGNVRFSRREFQLGDVKEDKIDSVYLNIYNGAANRFIVRNIISSYPIHTESKNASILTGSGETMMFTFNGSMCQSYGPRVDTIRLLTNDDSIPRKTFLVKSNIVQNFDKLTPKEKADAPVFVVQGNEANIPELYLGEIGTYAFAVENKGKSELLIKGVYSDCNCMTASFEKGKLKKGKGKLIVTVNTKKMHGDIVKKITVITNDPKHTTETFTIRAKVVIPGIEPIQQ